jgi:UPF0755 protein
MAKRTAAILVGPFILAVWLSWGYYKSVTNPVISTALTIEIEKGDTFARITQKLIDQQVEINPLWFRIIAVQKNIINKLKAGEYELTAGLTYPQILEMFYEGRAKKYAITFPEGWSLKDILMEIEKYPDLTHSLPKLTIPDLTSQLGIADKNPEGWFFPDTYYFDKHATDISILKRAYEKMQSVLNTEWQGRELNLPYKTPYEALIMASIIEKETGAKSERDMIAGVFVRRLEKSMLLQTDPTVIYGMGDKYQGNIRATDLTTATAYNTYVISGLPPSPIAMPGREAIHAALHPSKNDSLYFVAKGDGSHHFSASLTEHNEAVNNFQKHKKK